MGNAAIIYKTDVDEIGVVLLAEKEHMAVIYGNDYSVKKSHFGWGMYHITVELNGVVVARVVCNEYINEMWKGVPTL